MQVVTIGQGDSKGTTITASIYDNGVAANLSGMSARFCMRLPDDSGYVKDSACTVSGNTISHTLNESRCAAAGGRTDNAYFEIEDRDGWVYSTARFRVVVLRACDA
jgi:hypothetical protein